MKIYLIDYAVPVMSYVLIGRTGEAFAQWLSGTRHPSLWLVLPPTWAAALYFGYFVYPPIARWLKG